MQKVNIRKPLYGNFCYIRETILDKAIKNGELLEITTPNGSGVVCPKDWKATGKRMEKVFKIPDCPMILYGNDAKEQANKLIN